MLSKNDPNAALITTIFTGPKWRFSKHTGKPNQLALLEHDGKKIAALVVVRPASSEDYALSEAGLKHLIGTGITDIYVVLGVRATNVDRPEFVAAEKASLVHERVRDLPPRDGQWGPYWWITAEFEPAFSSGGFSDSDVV
jgi:hypothetical protein